MQISHKKQKKNLHMLLNCVGKCHENDTVDVSHQYGLRRALLSSDYYHENIFVRTYYQYFSFGKKTVASVACIGTICLIAFVGGPMVEDSGVLTRLFSASAPVKEIRAADLPVEYLQELYRYGYLQYSYDDNGQRVYTASTVDQPVYITDSQPYAINLIMQN